MAPQTLSMDDFVAEEDTTPTTIEDVPQLVLPGGVPLFVATSDEAAKLIAEAGYSTYYMIAQQGFVEKKKLYYIPQLLKVTSTEVSTGITEARDTDIELATCASGVEYNMPLIPNSLITKVENFFRTVDKTMGTEAVVILIYDRSYFDAENPSEGWDVRVPQQNNNAVHCNYEPMSIADKLPAGSFVAGTIHSHPGMSAFASDTDHGDQSSEDGVHITIGWSTATRNQAEFHCEVTTGGESEQIATEAVIEVRVPTEDDDTFEDWMARVDKEEPMTINPASTQSTADYYLRTNLEAKVPRTALEYPLHLPDITKNIIIGLANTQTSTTSPPCPFCTITLAWIEVAMTNMCSVCGNLVIPYTSVTAFRIYDEEGLQAYLDAFPSTDYKLPRSTYSQIARAIATSNKEIYIWNPVPNNVTWIEWENRVGLQGIGGGASPKAPAPAWAATETT